MRIFVSIAAYRDPELVPTIEDCLAKARRPEQLRFGICWQHGDEEAPLPFAGDPRFRILDVPWQASRGACWARAAIMDLYDDEEYFLQIDSHHRFVVNWDDKVLAQMARVDSARPVLTAYPAAFVPGDPSSFGTEPMQIVFDRFTPEGIVAARPAPIGDWCMRTRPIRARFVAAGFLFAPGGFVRDVPYDPDLYFLGEEITLAVRAFTSGYDLFHPSEVILWHEYTRDYRLHKHWTDHVDARRGPTWHERDRRSLEKVRRFFEAPIVGRFGIGTVRTVEEYEAYAGLSFRFRRAQDHTRAGLEPPGPPIEPDWAERTRQYEIEIALDRTSVARLDCAFWFVGFHDEQGREIFRLDADRAEMVRCLQDERVSTVTIRRSFESQAPPAKWIVWPHSCRGEWLNRIEGDVVVDGEPCRAGSLWPANYLTTLS